MDAKVGTEVLEDATLTLITFTVEDLFVGIPDGVGFNVDSGSLVLAALKPKIPAGGADPRSWTALRASLMGASFTGIEGVTLTVGATVPLEVELNQASAGIAALNWQAALDLDDDNAYGEHTPGNTGNDDLGVEDAGGTLHPIDFTAEVLSATGDADIDLFGIVSGKVAFAFSRRAADVNLDGDADPEVDNAVLTTLYLGVQDVFIGFDGTGFHLTSGRLAVATLKPRGPPAGQPQTDLRSWTAVSASFVGAEFIGIPGLTLRADQLDVEINKGAGGATPPAALNWKTALRFGDTGAYSQPLVITGPDGGSVEIDHAGTLLRLAGTATIELEGFVFVHGSFAMEKGDDTFVTETGSTTPIKVSLLRVGLHDVNVFAGLGDPDANDDGIIDSDATIQATGIKLTNVELGLALMKQVGVAPAQAKSFMALTGSGNASLVGIPGFELAGSLQVNLNTGKNPLNTNPNVADAAIDFTKLPGGRMTIQTGPDPDGPAPAPSVDLAFTGALLNVAGSARISIDQFAFIAADFAFKKGTPRTVTLEGGATGQVTALEIGASNGRAFFGVGGPYWVDADSDGAYDDVSADGAMGLVISGVNVALVLATPTAASTALANYKSFIALKASGNVELVGIEGFTVAVTNLSLELNDAKLKPTAPPAFVARAMNLSLAPIVVQVGPDPDLTGPLPAPTVALNFAAKTFRAFGTFTLAVGEFVYVTGNAAFEKVNPTVMREVGSATNITVEGMKIGASGVNIFVGAGGDGPDAVGLRMQNVAFALAMLKPVAVGAVKSPRSYFALKASASAIELVGIDGVTIAATGLNIEVNSSSDSTVLAPALPGVLNFAATPLTVATSQTTSQQLTFGSRLLRASGRVDLGLAAADLHIGADVFFESATRANGTKVTKIAFGDLNLELGGFTIKTGDQVAGQTPVAGQIQEVNGKLLLLPGGLAGEFTLHNLNFSVGNASAGLSFSAGTIEVAVNTTATRVLETFALPGGANEVLDVSAGPMFRLTVLGLDIAVKVAGKDAVTLHGNFAIEQLTIGTRKVLKVGATDVGITTPFLDPLAGEVTLSGGEGAFIIYSAVPGQPALPVGIAGTVRGQFQMASPILSAGSEVILSFNTMAVEVNETVAVGATSLRVQAAPNSFALTLRNATVEFPPYLSLTGDFTFRSTDTNGNSRPDRYFYGAAGVELFLGSGPYRNADGTVNPDAIGVLVTNATVGVVKLLGANDDPLFTADDTFAIYAFGTAALIGLEGLEVSGTVRVMINQTGQVISDTISLPDDGKDNNGNGQIDEPGEPGVQTIVMPFTSNRFVEQFEAGFNSQGMPAPEADQLRISAAGIFTLRGSVRFTVQPNGAVDAEIINAGVEISMPLGGNLTEVFALEGNGRFTFGGGQGFQLVDWRVTGFELFNEQIISLPPPAAQLRAPVADLAKPFNGQRVYINTLAGTIDVLYRDFNVDPATGLPIAIDNDSIIDNEAEFAIVGQAASGVTVNGKPVRDAINPNLYHYSYTGTFSEAGDPDPFHTVEVRFLPSTFKNARNVVNVAESEFFRVYFESAPGGFAPLAATTVPPPPPVPTAKLASPFNGSDRQPRPVRHQALHRRRVRPGLRRRHRRGHRRGRDQADRRRQPPRPRSRRRRLPERQQRPARRPEHVPLLPAPEGRLHRPEHVHGGRDRRGVQHARPQRRTRLAREEDRRHVLERRQQHRHVHRRPDLPDRRDRDRREPRRRPAHARQPDGRPGRHHLQGRRARHHDRDPDGRGEPRVRRQQPGRPAGPGQQRRRRLADPDQGHVRPGGGRRQGGRRHQRPVQAARGVQHHRQVGPGGRRLPRDGAGRLLRHRQRAEGRLRPQLRPGQEPGQEAGARRPAVGPDRVPVLRRDRRDRARHGRRQGQARPRGLRGRLPPRPRRAALQARPGADQHGRGPAARRSQRPAAAGRARGAAEDRLRRDPRVRRPADRRDRLRDHVRRGRAELQRQHLLRLRRRDVPARQGDLGLDHGPHDVRADRRPAEPDRHRGRPRDARVRRRQGQGVPVPRRHAADHARVAADDHRARLQARHGRRARARSSSRSCPSAPRSGSATS